MGEETDPNIPDGKVHRLDVSWYGDTVDVSIDGIPVGSYDEWPFMSNDTDGDTDE